MAYPATGHQGDDEIFCSQFWGTLLSSISLYICGVKSPHRSIVVQRSAPVALQGGRSCDITEISFNTVVLSLNNVSLHTRHILLLLLINLVARLSMLKHLFGSTDRPEVSSNGFSWCHSSECTDLVGFLFFPRDLGLCPCVVQHSPVSADVDLQAE